jgi:DNA polymerase III subunit beta
MQVKVLQENLSKSLLVASRFASSKVQLPVLANILLSAQNNKLLISATNLEMSVCITVGAKVEEDGKITVPAKVLTDLITNLSSGQVEIKAEKERLVIKAGGFSSVVSGMNASDFPAVPQALAKSKVKMSAGDFSDALSKVLFAVSVDETRPVLTGVLLVFSGSNLILVSTDGFRLSHKKLNLDSKLDGVNIILPKGVLSEILKLAGDIDDLEVSIQKDEGQVVFGVGGIVLTSRIIEGSFPDYEKIVPKESLISLNLDKTDLLRAVKLASVFARDAANVIKFKLGKNSLSVTAESSQSGSEESEVEVKIDGEVGKDLVFAFNYRFIEEFLGVCEGESIDIKLTSPDSPALFLDAKDKDYFHIIMPVKLQG